MRIDRCLRGRWMKREDLGFVLGVRRGRLWVITDLPLTSS